MGATELSIIRNNPKFRELERKRSVFGWTLSALMLAIYMGFIFLVAFDHGFVAQVTGPGPITMAFPLGLGVIVAAVVLTGVYVVRANSEFDRLTRDILGQSDPAPQTLSARLAAAR